MKTKMYRPIFAIAIFIVFSAPTAHAASSYDFTCESPVTAVEQFDGEVKYDCLVKNTGDSYLELFYEVAPEQNPVDSHVAVGFHPQPPRIYLEVGESQPITGFEAPPRVPANKNEIRYSRVFTIRPAEKSMGAVTNKSITVSTIIIKGPLVDDARVSGKILDGKTEQAVKNANISFKYKNFERRSAGRDGFYSTQLPSLQYLMQVDAPGYELYVTTVSPHGEVTKDVRLTRAEKSGSYSLIRDVKLDSGAWEGVWRSAVSDDGRYVAFGMGGVRKGSGTDAYFYLFSVSGEQILKIKTFDEVRGIDISPDGSFVAVSLGDGRSSSGGSAFEKVLVYKKNGELLWKKYTDEDVYFEVRFSHDGKYLAVGDRGGYVHLLDATDGTEIWKKFTRGQVRAIEFYDDTSHVFVGSGDDNVYLFDIHGNEKWKTYVHSWPYGFIATTRGNDYSAAGGHMGYLHLLDKNGKNLWSYEADGGFRWAEIGPAASFVVGGTRSELSFLDSKGKILWKGYDSVSGATTKDKKYILSGNQKGELELRNLNGTILWAHRTGEMEPGKDVRFAYISDDASVIVGAIKNGEIYFFKGGITQAPAQPPTQNSTPTPERNKSSDREPANSKDSPQPPRPPVQKSERGVFPPENDVARPFGEEQPPLSHKIVVPYFGNDTEIIGVVDPRDMDRTTIRGIRLQGMETESARLEINGVGVRDWNQKTKDAVRAHLEKNDTRNDQNDFGLYVALRAIEKESVRDIVVYERNTDATKDPVVSVDYQTTVKVFGFLKRNVTAHALVFTNDSTDYAYDAPWYVRWFSTKDDQTEFTDVAREVKKKLDATAY